MTVTVVEMMVVCATKTDIRADQSILKSNAALGAAVLLYIRRRCVHQQNNWSLYLCIKTFSLNTQRFFLANYLDFVLHINKVILQNLI